MWFEILPTIFIIAGSLAVPQYCGAVINYIFKENLFSRSLGNDELQLQYFRDSRLTGSPYRVAGLENVPDGGICDERFEEGAAESRDEYGELREEFDEDNGENYREQYGEEDDNED